MNCPACGKELALTLEKALYCPYCGQKLVFSDDAQLNELLQRAGDESDPAKKHELLLEARKHFPDCLEVEKQLLMLGRLWEKGGKPDFYRIPFWPLSALEKPREFSGRERKKMLERFFHDPEAERVAALAEDRTAFFAEYYGEMAKKYLEWFVKDASSNNSILFFRRSEKSRLVQYLACVHNMLMNLGISRDVPEAAKPLMRAAIERACRDVFGTEP